MTTILKVCHECETYCDPKGKNQVDGHSCNHKKYTYWPENFGDKKSYTEIPPHDLTEEELAEIYSEDVAKEMVEA